MSLLRAFERHRTGGIKLDYERIKRLTSRVVTKWFTHVGCPRGKVRPKTRLSRGRLGTTVRDAKTGGLRQVVIRAQRNPDPGNQRNPLAITTTKSRRSQPDLRTDAITLAVPPASEGCGSRVAWTQVIAEIMAHELTHASDPGVVRRRPVATARRLAMTYCEDVQQPAEQTAHLNQIRYEMEAFLMKLPGLQHLGPADLLKASRDWKTIEPCLTPRQRRRFLRMAARVAAEGR